MIENTQNLYFGNESFTDRSTPNLIYNTNANRYTNNVYYFLLLLINTNGHIRKALTTETNI